MGTVNTWSLRLIYFTCLWSAGLNAAPDAFFSCTDYHCDTGMTVALSDAQWQAVEAIFNGNRSPRGERQRIGAAIALLEQQVGALTGTARDLAGTVDGRGLPGQLDCIAESKNTTTYLNLLTAAGLLQWHSIEERQRRRRYLVNIHWSATIRDNTSGRRYVVDSWFGGNGEPPVIQPLDDWLSGKRPDTGQKNLGDE